MSKLPPAAHNIPALRKGLYIFYDLDRPLIVMTIQ